MFLWISDFKFESSIKFGYGYHYIDLKKVQTKIQKKTRSDRSGIGFWSEFFKNKYDDGHSSIRFIQNLMLNSNLKSEIQKNI
jgi:hypothetical protein